MKSVYKTKKILTRPNKGQRNKYVFLFEESRLFYNDIINLYKTFFYHSTFQRRIRKFQEIATAMGGNIPESAFEEIELNRVNFGKIWSKDSREVLLGLKKNQWSAFGLSYLVKYHLRPSNYITSEVMIRITDDIAKNIKVQSANWKNFLNKKTSNAPGDFKYISRGQFSTVPFRRAKDISETHVTFSKKRGGGEIAPLKYKKSGGYFMPEMEHTTVSLTKDEKNRYFTCITVKEEVPDNFPSIDEEIGIDWGVVNLATLSNGKQYPSIKNHKRFKFLTNKLKSLQKQLALQKRGGKNRQKTKDKIARTHAQISNIKNTYIEQVTSELSNYKKVVIEDLNISNMTTSAKGTVEEPGSKVAQKAGLNREILNHSPFKFRLRLEQKCKNKNTEFKVVNPRFTSQTCSSCGHASKENRLTQSQFKCEKCKYECNADINAAKNILNLGK
jgi:transposase